MLFSLVPWLLSLLVFFPAVGGGLFGADLDAGPLPAIGNLVLHLIYGAILGTVYCIPESAASTEDDRRAAQLENDGTALGLVVGLTAAWSSAPPSRRPRHRHRRRPQPDPRRRRHRHGHRRRSSVRSWGWTYGARHEAGLIAS